MKVDLNIDYNPASKRYSVNADGISISGLTYKTLLRDMCFLFLIEGRNSRYFRLNLTQAARENTEEKKAGLLESLVEHENIRRKKFKQGILK